MEEKIMRKKALSWIVTIAMALSLFTAMPITAGAAGNVCEVDGVQYLTLDEAIEAAGNGGTITLLTDIRYQKEIILKDKNLHFDLKTYRLNIGNGTSDPALEVDGGTLSIDDDEGGEFNIVAGYIGLKLLNGGSATVTSVSEERESALAGYGISANGGTATVKGNIKVTGNVGEAMNVGGGCSIRVMGDIECRKGITVGGSGTKVIIDGNITSKNGTPIEAYNGGSVTVKGDASGAFRGISAYGRSGDGGKVHVLGNVSGAGEYGIEAFAGSEVIVDGYVSSLKGLKAYGGGTSITVKGDTTSTGADEHGASALAGGLTTIDGKITAPEYVLIEQTTMSEAEGVLKGRHKVYSDGTSTVRLKGLEFFKEDFEIGINNPGWVCSGDPGWSITDHLRYPEADAHSGYYVGFFNSWSLTSSKRSLFYQTKSLNLANGSEYCLEFWMYHDDGYDGYDDRIIAQISTDRGSSWSDLGTFHRYGGTGWLKESISLSAYTGEPDVRIGFLGLPEWGNNIFIDDISVSHKCIAGGCSTGDAYGGFIESSERGGKTYYHVSTPEQLAHISEHPNHNFILTEDIDLSGRQWIPIGKTSATSFNGHFDGNGHSISGLTITRACEADAYGLFGFLGRNGIIENLTLESGDIGFSEAAGNGYFGGIVGYSEGLVKNCVNKAHVIIMYGGWSRAGGIVGVGNSDINSLDGWSARIYGCRNEGSIRIDGVGSAGGIIGAQFNSTSATYIDQCSNSGTVRGGAGAEAGGIAGRINRARSIGIVNCFNTGEVYSGGIYANAAYAGGIVGYDYYSQVKNCYNTGKVQLFYDSLGNTFCGGIAGYALSAAENCYNVGQIEGTGKAGEGIIGSEIPGANCYYLDTSTQSAEVEGIKSLTASEMKTQASFANWDFPGTWTINRDDNGGYPALAWQGFQNVAASSDATLSALTATDVNLNPVFAAETTNYTANAANNIGSTTIDATASDAGAKISIDGTVATSKEVALAVGNNVITIEVTAEDGISTKTYTITITRAAAPPAGGGASAPTDRQVTVTTPDGRTVVTGTLAESSNTEQITISETRFRTLADANRGAMVPAPSAIVTFDTKATNTINNASSTGDVVLTIEKLDRSKLTPEQRELVGDRPVYDFTLKKGNQEISSFGGGHAKISIPYTLQPGENPHQVVIYYLTSDGSLKPVRGHYDAKNKCVVFKTTHFSTYAVGYNPVSFNDVAAGAWYNVAIDFIAAREITSGTGVGKFSPEATLTRGQFVVLLMNAYEISPDAVGEGTTNFTDAGNTYYTKYLLAAKSLGIVSGVGNNMFAPERAVTRQEMFVMLYNALDVIGELPQTSGDKQLSDFEDADQVAAWSQDAISALIEGGVIYGSNGMLNPQSTTTRAEMAQMLYNLLSK
jgi:hypothetical protein